MAVWNARVSARRSIWRRAVPRVTERRLASALGYRPRHQIDLDSPFTEGPYGFDEEAAIRKAVERVRAGTMCSLERLAALWDQPARP